MKYTGGHRLLFNSWRSSDIMCATTEGSRGVSGYPGGRANTAAPTLALGACSSSVDFGGFWWVLVCVWGMDMLGVCGECNIQRM